MAKRRPKQVPLRIIILKFQREILDKPPGWLVQERSERCIVEAKLLEIRKYGKGNCRVPGIPLGLKDGFLVLVNIDSGLLGFDNEAGESHLGEKDSLAFGT